MVNQDLRIFDRAWKRADRISRRIQERIRGLPLRASERRQGRPVPPGHLIHLIANTEDVAWFLDTGSLAARSIREVLASQGVAIEDFSSILDFGCGIGRVLRQWSELEGPVLHGTDYNPSLVRWCRTQLPFVQFQVNSLDAPLDAQPSSYDFIYCLSVFTHLSETLQRFWIDELVKVLKPGGYLLITTHGDHYLPMLSEIEQEQYRRGNLVVQKGRREGTNDCAAFHPESYVRGNLAQGLEVVAMRPEGALGNPCQDLYLFRKPCSRNENQAGGKESRRPGD
jgi:SAM-dependent methyltransferase